jgi:hypothetical protein
MGRSEAPKALEICRRIVEAGWVRDMVWRRVEERKTTLVPF